MIRLVEPHEGPKIQALMVKCQVTPLVTNLDWHKPVGPYWLVCGKKDTHFDGAVNVAYSQPLGRIEMLLIDPDLPRRTQAILVKHLSYGACEVLSQAGAQAAGSYISDADPSWQRIVTKRGSRPVETGTFFLRKV